jgi:ribosomal protein S18 acetylase RimI-like enzyme
VEPLFSASTHCKPDPSESLSNSSHLIIRAAEPKDLASLAEVLTDSFHSQAGIMRWIYPLLRMGIYEDLRGRLRSTSPHYICLVAVKPSRSMTATYPGDASDDLAGTIEMGLRSTQPWQIRDSQYLYLSNLAVRPEYRRQGIAKQLLIDCERRALAWGFQDLYLHVLDNNHPARQLYLNAGYELQKEEPSWNSWLLRQPQRLFLHKHLIPSSTSNRSD